MQMKHFFEEGGEVQGVYSYILVVFIFESLIYKFIYL